MQYKTPLLLLVVVAFLVGADYLVAWTVPSANPPNNNVAAPINTGSAYQAKTGDLGAVRTRVGQYCDAGGTNCGLSIGGVGRDVAITGSSPTLLLNDNSIGTNPWDSEGMRDFMLHTNNNRLYALVDRDDDGNLYEPEDSSTNGWPMMMYAGNSSRDDYVRFSNQVHASAYCDSNGQNCSSSVGSLGQLYTYSTNANPRGYGERGACSCRPEELLTGCSGFQKGDNDTQQLSGNRNGCYTDGETTAMCHCLGLDRALLGFEYSWSTGGWSCSASWPSCGQTTYGTNTRTVVCKDAIGTVVDDSYCPSPKPDTNGGSCTRVGSMCHERPG